MFTNLLIFQVKHKKYYYYKVILPCLYFEKIIKLLKMITYWFTKLQYSILSKTTSYIVFINQRLVLIIEV